MKKILTIGMLLSSLLFGKWGNWQKVQAVSQRKELIEGSYLAAIENTAETDYKSIYIAKDDAITMEFGANFQLSDPKTHKISFRVDYNRAIELTGDIKTSFTTVPLKSNKYVVFDMYLNDNEENFEKLMGEMEKGKMLKIILTQDGKERLIQIPLTGFLPIFKEI
ncbi:hypothetical protein [Fusobacterium sp. PH5-44]|uniref:hypothetical protein n=1 Tax=unclassified Fusobacterium TaxID=2648384 RepID=UPI003D1D953B